MRDTLGSSTDMPEVSAHSGPAEVSPFFPVAYRITLWNSSACSEPAQILGGEQAAEPWLESGGVGASICAAEQESKQTSASVCDC